MPAQRTCLGPLCRGKVAFASTHAGNRLCEKCRNHQLDQIAKLYGLQRDQLI